MRKCNTLKHMGNCSRLEVREVISFLWAGKDFLILAVGRYSSMILPTAQSTRDSKTAAKILVRKCGTFPILSGFGTLWFSCSSPWRSTCQDIFSPAMKTSNVLPSRGYRNIDIYSVRPGWIDFSHAWQMPQPWRGLLICSVPVILYCVLSGSSNKTWPSVYKNCKRPLLFMFVEV